MSKIYGKEGIRRGHGRKWNGNWFQKAKNWFDTILRDDIHATYQLGRYS